VKAQSSIIIFFSFIITATLFYFLGHLLTIPWLMFQYKFTRDPFWLSFSIGSFFPLMLGVVVSFLIAWLLLFNSSRKTT
jgi:hypothetical protein